MRVVFGAALIAAFGAFAAPAAADPKSELMSAFIAFGHAASYHEEMTTPDGHVVAIDNIVPDKMHMTMNAGEIQMIRIAGDTWVKHGGTWMHLTMPIAQVNSMISMAHPRGLDPHRQDTMTVTFVGNEMLNKVAARHYRLLDADKTLSDIWIGPNNLPLQMQSHSKSGDSTLVFSNYNAVADITPPSM